MLIRETGERMRGKREKRNGEKGRKEECT